MSKVKSLRFVVTSLDSKLGHNVRSRWPKETQSLIVCYQDQYSRDRNDLFEESIEIVTHIYIRNIFKILILWSAIVSPWFQLDTSNFINFQGISHVFNTLISEAGIDPPSWPRLLYVSTEDYWLLSIHSSWPLTECQVGHCVLFNWIMFRIM